MVAAAGAGTLLSLSISQAYAVLGLLFHLVYIIVILSIVELTFAKPQKLRRGRSRLG